MREGRVKDHLHTIATWIFAIEASRAVAMRAWLGGQRNAVRLEKGVPGIDILDFVQNEANVIQSTSR
jgi:hypothetical protein